MTEQLRGTVLCAAEAEADRRVFSDAFREAGFQVMEATTGGELVRWAIEKPVLILLAGSLGHLDSFDACRHLKSDPNLAAIPVVIRFPGPMTIQDRARALESGADDFLVDPVEPAALIAHVEALLQAGKGQPAVRQRSGLTKAQAEDLLDWLENHGYPAPEMAYVDGKGFVVRWQGRPNASTASAGGCLLRLFRRIIFGT